MRIMLFILAILAFLAGFGILASAKSAVHEIEAFVLFATAAVLFGSAGIIEAINTQTKKLLENKPQ